MYKVLIVEDDSVQAESLECALGQFGDCAERSFQIQRVSGVEEFESKGLQDAAFDIVLADIELGSSSQSGIDFARKYFPADSGVQVIFVSGHIEYCTKVYEANHIYFLVKPVVQSDFAAAIAKATGIVEATKRQQFSISSGGKIITIPTSSIEYIESNRRKVCVHSYGGNYEAYAALDDIACKLPDSFLRCRKSFVVNMAYIVHMNGGSLELRSGAVIPVSQSRRKATKEYFVKYLRRG